MSCKSWSRSRVSEKMSKLLEHKRCAELIRLGLCHTAALFQTNLLVLCFAQQMHQSPPKSPEKKHRAKMRSDTSRKKIVLIRTRLITNSAFFGHGWTVPKRAESSQRFQDCQSYHTVEYCTVHHSPRSHRSSTTSVCLAANNNNDDDGSDSAGQRGRTSRILHLHRRPIQQRLLCSSRQRTNLFQLCLCTSTQAGSTSSTASHSRTHPCRAVAQLAHNLVRIAEPKTECHEGSPLRTARYALPAPTPCSYRDDPEGAHSSFEQAYCCM